MIKVYPTYSYCFLLSLFCLIAEAKLEELPAFAPCYVPPVASGSAEVVVDRHGADLSGAWTLRLDDEKEPVGEQESWYRSRGFEETIDLPGAVQNGGFGGVVTAESEWIGGSGLEQWFAPKYQRYREPGNVKIPFFLQPERRFLGPAWYQKTIHIGEDAAAGRDLILTLERTHWFSTVWFDGREIGSQDSICAPHVYHLGRDIKPGSYSLVVRIDNRYLLPIGPRAHSITDETQGAWNGIIGEIGLSWRNPVYIQQVKTFPDHKTRTARIVVDIANLTKAIAPVEVSVRGERASLNALKTTTRYETVVQFPESAALWSEFHPVLHPVELLLKSDFGTETQTLNIGLVNYATEGRKILVNGKETFMRGTLDCANFPLTGYPPTSVEDWLVHLRKMQATGINHVRFHSWCPPRAAFIAADQLGMYLQPEAGMWLTGEVHEPLASWMRQECKRVIDTYGNHPSFAFFTHGNEPNNDRNPREFLTELTKELKAYDSRMLHMAAANHVITDEDEVIVTAHPRGPRGWFGRGYEVNFSRPFIQHEPGQHCVYPNFDEMIKYTGPLKPKNFEIFMEQAVENGVFHQWRDFHLASGKLQVICYKADCEAALLSEGIAGTQLLGIADFSGQGSALVGFLDVFYDEKSYVTSEEFASFWNASVPLARMTRHTFTQAEALEVEVIHAHFGAEVLQNQTLVWEIVDADGTVVRSGRFEDLDIAHGRNRVGTIRTPLASLNAPAKYELRLALQGGVPNRWDFWVYEANPEIDKGSVHVARALDDETMARLDAGESVLLFPKDYSRAHPNMHIAPIFWNRFMFSHLKERVTLGLLIDDQHPALQHFPSDFHSNWNWAEILKDSHGIVMNELPAEGLIVQPIDDWNTNRRLGYIFELKLSKGKLLVCMPDLEQKMAESSAAVQLYSSLLKYMNSPAFAPTASTRKATLEQTFRYAGQISKLVEMGASVYAAHDSGETDAAKTIDGDPSSKWRSKSTGEASITLDLGSSRTFQGLGTEDTTIKRMRVYIGDTPDQLELVPVILPLIGESEEVIFKRDQAISKQQVEFKREVKGRYLKLEVLDSHSARSRVLEVGEVDVIPIFR